MVQTTDVVCVLPTDHKQPIFRVPSCYDSTFFFCSIIVSMLRQLVKRKPVLSQPPHDNAWVFITRGIRRRLSHLLLCACSMRLELCECWAQSSRSKLDRNAVALHIRSSPSPYFCVVIVLARGDSCSRGSSTHRVYIGLDGDTTLARSRCLSGMLHSRFVTSPKPYRSTFRHMLRVRSSRFDRKTGLRREG